MNDRIKSCNELAGAAPEPVGEEVEVVGVAILGGLFYGGSGPELGDIDLELNPDVLERIQAELVNSSDDVMISLMTVTQHQRIVEGLQVTNYLQEVRLQDAFEVIDQLKAEVARLKQEKSDLKHSLTKSQQETYQAEVLMVEIGEERDRLKAEVERLKGQSIDDQKHMLGIIEERNALRAQLARHDDASHNLNELLKRGAKAIGIDTENTSWFEVIGELEKLAAQKVVIELQPSDITQACNLRKNAMTMLYSDVVASIEAAGLKVKRND
jgi:chromosome segregation ATPase